MLTDCGAGGGKVEGDLGGSVRRLFRPLFSFGFSETISRLPEGPPGKS
jgi:hypothetical protein